MKIAYCQIKTHPAFIGVKGSYLNEPFIDQTGVLLNLMNDEDFVSNISDKINGRYARLIESKVSQILSKLNGQGIELLIFPEYSIPAYLLPVLKKFSENNNCIIVAASHTVQNTYKQIYESLNIDIDLNKKLRMSCCPIIFPDGKIKTIFKKHQSKWENNMVTDNGKYYPDAYNSSIYIINGVKTNISICIDALKETVNTSDVELVLVPALSPSSGQFYNKGEFYLSNEIPMVFCNGAEYGGSTIFCRMPTANNIPFSSDTRIVPADRNEEVVVVTEIEIDQQFLKYKTTQNRSTVNVLQILPIYYKDNEYELSFLNSIINQIETGDLSNINAELLNSTYTGKGIVSAKLNFVCDGIKNGVIRFEEALQLLRYIYINDFSLEQYEANWTQKASMLLQEGLLSGKVKNSDIALEIQNRLLAQNLKYRTFGEIVQIPVFEESVKDDSYFQNRGGEIRLFNKTLKNSDKSIFIVCGFAGIGKTEFIERLKSLYYFSTQNIALPDGSGIEKLVLALGEAIHEKIDWTDLNEKEIEQIAAKLSRKIACLNKTLLVLRNVGKIFDDYNKMRSILLLKCIARNLIHHHSSIKIIMETQNNLPIEIIGDENFQVCKLKPLIDVYVERLIEQITNKNTYGLFLPQIPFQVVRNCMGNPGIAKIVGVYISEKLNEDKSATIEEQEMEAFRAKYIEGIFAKLKITENEVALLNDISIFRVPVRRNAFKLFGTFDEKLFSNLERMFIIESIDEKYVLNSLIRKYLSASNQNDVSKHTIAASYYKEEGEKSETAYIEKAEYLYHASFTSFKGFHEKELKLFSDDILTASIKLCENGSSDLALSHLQSIKKWKSNYWKYHLNIAICYILTDNYSKYNEEFLLACNTYPNNVEIIYYLMIKNLIRYRKLGEAENLLNEASEKFEPNTQLRALWSSYLYSSMSTRNEAINSALMQSRENFSDIYTTQILVRILVRENMLPDALKAIEKVLRVWSNNEWALRMRKKLIESKDCYENDDYEDDQDV